MYRAWHMCQVLCIYYLMLSASFPGGKWDSKKINDEPVAPATQMELGLTSVLCGCNASFLSIFGGNSFDVLAVCLSSVENQTWCWAHLIWVLFPSPNMWLTLTLFLWGLGWHDHIHMSTRYSGSGPCPCSSQSKPGGYKKATAGFCCSWKGTSVALSSQAEVLVPWGDPAGDRMIKTNMLFSASCRLLPNASFELLRTNMKFCSENLPEWAYTPTF